jgi:hypothetical protein
LNLNLLCGVLHDFGEVELVRGQSFGTLPHFVGFAVDDALVILNVVTQGSITCLLTRLHLSQKVTEIHFGALLETLPECVKVSERCHHLLCLGYRFLGL